MGDLQSNIFEQERKNNSVFYDFGFQMLLLPILLAIFELLPIANMLLLILLQTFHSDHYLLTTLIQCVGFVFTFEFFFYEKSRYLQNLIFICFFFVKHCGTIFFQNGKPCQIDVKMLLQGE